MALVLGYITCENVDEAEKIARVLLNERLIACANIVDNISSLYRWKGKIEESNEALLIVKSESGRIDKIIEKVKKLHSYDVPSIDFVQMKSSRECEKWLRGELK